MAAYKLHGEGQEQPSAKALEAILQQILAAFVDVYIMIDSLDESGDRTKVLKWIETLAKWSSAKWHLLVTSRPEPEITMRLDGISNLQCVFLKGAEVDKDIGIYLDEELSLIDYWSESTRALIKSTLIEGAGGM